MILFKQWTCFALIYLFCLGLLDKGRKHRELKGFPHWGSVTTLVSAPWTGYPEPSLFSPDS